MKDLKDTFKVETDEDIQSIIKNSGSFLSWKIVSLSDNEIEFHHTKHLTGFTTTVSWTNDGNINLSSNFRRSGVKFDGSGYRRGFNEQIKLSIQNELNKKTNLEQSESNVSIENNSNQSTPQNIGENKITNDFEEKIKQKDKSQNNKLIIVAIIGIIIMGIVYVNKQSKCGCSESDLIELQKSRLLSRSGAIEYCCKLQKVADEYNSK